MEIISEKDCMDFIKEKFPKLVPYWDSYIKDWGGDNGLIIQLTSFEDYTLDTIKSNNEPEIRKIFDVVEFLLCNGDQTVKDAIATGFLECMMNQELDENQFARYLGKQSAAYCRAWDEFTGCKTKGLWKD